MPQKKSLKQIEKQQSRKGRSEDKKQKVERIIGALESLDLDSEEIMNQLRGMKAITLTSLGLRLNLKVSIAKKLLDQLEKQSMLNVVLKSHNLKVYTLK